MRKKAGERRTETHAAGTDLLGRERRGGGQNPLLSRDEGTKKKKGKEQKKGAGGIRAGGGGRFRYRDVDGSKKRPKLKGGANHPKGSETRENW